MTTLSAPSSSLDPAAVQDPNTVIREFAANPAFRAAEREELINDDNPFRRPVRPDDLDWLDYAGALRSENVLTLSGLLGHRMLRNTYDTDLLFLPPTPNQAARQDGSDFYSPRSRFLAAAARPILEHHLFDLLTDHRAPLATPDLATLTRGILDTFEHLRSHPAAAPRTAQSAHGRTEATTYLLIQHTAIAPALGHAVAHAAIGDYGWAHPQLRHTLLDDQRIRAESADDHSAALHGAALTDTTAAYWQFSLGTSLARGNYLHMLSRDRSRLSGFIGAYLHTRLQAAVDAPRWAELFTDNTHAQQYFHRTDTLTPDTLTELIHELVHPLTATLDEAAVIDDVWAGFSDAAWLYHTWDRDLDTQLSWADSIPEYQRRAERLDKYITDHGLQVDLDTFVESSDETSTTHVHDDHRLVMIERGDMLFWNNVTHKIALHTGDKVLIPISRLHGSTVISGTCTYHQPIIPDSLLQQAL